MDCQYNSMKLEKHNTSTYLKIQYGGQNQKHFLFWFRKVIYLLGKSVYSLKSLAVHGNRYRRWNIDSISYTARDKTTFCLSRHILFSGMLQLCCVLLLMSLYQMFRKTCVHWPIFQLQVANISVFGCPFLCNSISGFLAVILCFQLIAILDYIRTKSFDLVFQANTRTDAANVLPQWKHQ
jgi:hypothetical protein